MTSMVSADEIWERIGEFRPQLRKHIHVHVQVYRGDRWYLLRDELNGRVLRLNSRAYGIVGRLDGKVTLQTLFDYLKTKELHDITEAEVVDLVGRLHGLDALSNVLDKGTVEMVEKYRERRRVLRLKKMLSPLMIRVPLYDPDELLDQLTPKLGWLFSGAVAAVWMVVVALGLVSAIDNAALISNEFTSNVLKPGNLLLLWLLFPLMKLLHEFAHAIVVKHWDGDVHEMGITLLVLTPIPYVDASAASTFKSKRKRVFVGAAGILIELFLASIALVFWLNASDGLLRDCAFGVFTIGAISTVLFNANPLLKFDGYFVLQDLIEIPNLMSRSLQYYAYLFKRYVVRLEHQLSPVTASGERKWFLLYGFASTCYRVAVLFFIIVFLSGKYLVLGVILGCWAFIQQLIMPAIKFIRFMLIAPETNSQRGRARAVLGGGVVLAVLVLGVLPMPSSTRTQGVVWVPQQGEIFAESAGFVSELFVEPGQNVEPGQVLLQLNNPELTRAIQVLEQELAILDIKATLVRSIDPARFAVMQQDIAALQRSLHEQTMQQHKLKVIANTSGTFTPVQQQKLLGRYFKQGDFIAHIVDPSELVVRVAIPDTKSGLVTQGVNSASVKLAEALQNTIEANLINEVPAADHKLPSPALGAAGGGGIAIASSDETGVTTVESVFHLQLGLPGSTNISGVGERAYVTLRHNAEPLATRWLRSIRQVFLKTLPA